MSTKAPDLKCLKNLVAVILYAVLAGPPRVITASAAGLDEGWSLGGSSLNRGDKARYKCQFYAGVNIVIIASGDKDATVTVRPKSTGKYAIEMHLAEACAPL